MSEYGEQDFIVENQGTNTFLVYHLKRDEEIDTFTYGMISNNKIKGIIPVVLTQINDKMSVKFNVSSKISLEQYNNGIVNKSRFLTLLSGIAGAVLEGEEYMLDSSCFILKPSFIYVNVGTGEPELICFPVKGKYEPVDLFRFYKDLVFSTQFDQTENTDYVAKVISFLNSSTNFSLPDFKKMTDSLSSKTEDTKRALTDGRKPGHTPAKAPEPVYIPERPVSMSPTVPIPADQEKARTAPAIPEKKEKEKKEKGKRSLFRLGGNEKKEKKEKPKKEAKYKKNVRTGIAIPGMETEDTKEPITGTQPVQPEKKESLKTRPVPLAKEIPVKKPVIPSPAPPVNSYGGMPETTVLSYGDSGETTVLSAEEQSADCRPYLFRIKTGEKIYINKPVFKIGKERSFVDFCIMDNPAVSRIHANVLSRENGFYIMDMNSKNHTFVNGSMVTSNQEYPLKNGDTLCLANDSFEFKTR